MDQPFVCKEGICQYKDKNGKVYFAQVTLYVYSLYVYSQKKIIIDRKSNNAEISHLLHS